MRGCGRKTALLERRRSVSRDPARNAGYPSLASLALPVRRSSSRMTRRMVDPAARAGGDVLNESVIDRRLVVAAAAFVYLLAEPIQNAVIEAVVTRVFPAGRDDALVSLLQNRTSLHKPPRTDLHQPVHNGTPSRHRRHCERDRQEHAGCQKLTCRSAETPDPP